MRGNLALALLALAFAIGLGELGLRYAGFGRPLIYEFDSELLWAHAPNQAAYSPALGVPYEINSDGLRDLEISRQKRPGEFRILMLGDSVTFGQGVGFTETVPQRLEKLLTDSSPFNAVEVINAGVSGYSTRQQRIFLERQGLSYAPDLVILGFVHNDLITRDLWTELQGDVRRRGATRGWERWREMSAWTHLLHGLYDRLVDGDSAQALGYLPADEAAGAWDFTVSELSRISQILSAADISFTVLVYPLREDVVSGVARDIAPLERFADEAGVDILDLYPVLAELSDEAIFLDPVHPTALANEVVAKASARYLINTTVARQQDAQRLMTVVPP